MTILQHSIAQAAAGGGGYQIARNLRFNSADSAYLNRTPASAGNRRTWTWSGWLKRSMLSDTYGDRAVLFGGHGAMSNTEWIEFGFGNSGDGTWNTIYSTTSGLGGNSTSLYRDTSAWYHVVIALDTTQATQANRLKIYFNGVLTDFPSASFGAVATQNVELGVNGAWAHTIGKSPYSGVARNLNGYLADIRFIDGQQLDPTSFGEFDANTGVWMPKTYSGTYGTNGFWLKFDDNSNNTAATLGKDSSGNGNNWTPNNFSVTAGVGNDSLVDSPTNYGTDTGAGGEVRGNYCTWNPLDKNSNTTLVNGNLDASYLAAAWAAVRATFGLTSGKWYWEVTPTTLTTSITIGIGKADSALSFVGASATSWGYYNSTGVIYNNSSGTAYGASYAVNNVIGVALDLDNGTLTFYKNGTSQGTAVTGLTSGPYFPMVGHENAASSTNFGQRPFAYTAPSGFKALCTQNLPTPAIGATSSTLASKNMNVVTYTGTGASRTITGVGFQPDLVWAKSRSQASNNVLNDAVRGAGLTLQSDLTAAEVNEGSAGLTGFNSDGFTIGGSSGGWNTNAATYVGWAFKGANTTVSNTSGSITSTVSANPTAGISIATYTAPSASGDFTFGHGLGVAPKLFITRFRSTSNWAVYHQSVGANAFLKLNSTDASTSSAGCWGTGPTSSLITVKQSAILGAAGDCIAYAFSEVAGFSKFGSYTGNGSADGTFVYTGFRPKYVVIKNTASGSWEQYDTARDTYNQASLILEPNSSGAEATAAGYVLDFLSNGFKLRGTGSGINTSGNTFIFAAFAEAPFNYSRAR